MTRGLRLRRNPGYGLLNTHQHEETTMRTLIIASVTALGIVAATSLAADNRATEADKGQWLSIQQALAKVESAGYRNIERIERENGGYEVKATDRHGQRMKLYLHPRTGEIVEQRQRDAKRGSHDRRDGANDGRSSVECNKRRCHDDMTAAGNTINATK